MLAISYSIFVSVRIEMSGIRGKIGNTFNTRERQGTTRSPPTVSIFSRVPAFVSTLYGWDTRKKWMLFSLNMNLILIEWLFVLICNCALVNSIYYTGKLTEFRPSFHGTALELSVMLSFRTFSSPAMLSFVKNARIMPLNFSFDALFSRPLIRKLDAFALNYYNHLFPNRSTRKTSIDIALSPMFTMCLTCKRTCWRIRENPNYVRIFFW